MIRSAVFRAALPIAAILIFSALLSAQAASPTSPFQSSAQNPVLGSVPDSKPTPGVLPLTFRDAIDRALRQNLASLLSEYNTVAARGQKWQQLSALLPNVN